MHSSASKTEGTRERNDTSPVDLMALQVDTSSRRGFTSHDPARGSGRVWSGLVGSSRVGPGGVGSGRVGSGRVGSGRVGSGRVGSGRVGSGRVGSGQEVVTNLTGAPLAYFTLGQ